MATSDVLKIGSESADVSNWQRFLISQGFDIEADGDFGEKTAAATRQFQASQGLRADGIVGENTFKAAQALKPDVGSVKPNGTAKVSSPNPGDVLSKVHPVLADKCRALVALALRDGFTLRITQGLRTFEEQDKLFAKRPRVTKARGGQSMHNYGLAVDFAFVVNGTIDYIRDDRLYNKIGAWAHSVGLEWGGDWKFVDRPHVQLKNLPSYKVLLPIYRQGGLAAVWSRYNG